jgi:hypothetical protein
MFVLARQRPKGEMSSEERLGPGCRSTVARASACGLAAQIITTLPDSPVGINCDSALTCRLTSMLPKRGNLHTESGRLAQIAFWLVSSPLTDLPVVVFWFGTSVVSRLFPRSRHRGRTFSGRTRFGSFCVVILYLARRSGLRRSLCAGIRGGSLLAATHDSKWSVKQ